VTTPAPNACRHCDIERRPHGQRWTAAVGWHMWTPPGQKQIKARMIARRTSNP
jgi:hypothetical protein